MNLLLIIAQKGYDMPSYHCFPFSGQGTEDLAEYIEGLGAYNGFLVCEDERGHGGHAVPGCFLPGLGQFWKVPVAQDRFLHGLGIKAGLKADLLEHFEAADIEALGEIGREQGVVKSGEPVLFPAEFSGLKGQAGIGQKRAVAEGDAERRAHAAQMVHHAGDIGSRKKVGQGPPPWRRLGMDLEAAPFYVEVELQFQLFDDALADEAEWSDVVGKDLYPDGHGIRLSLR